MTDNEPREDLAAIADQLAKLETALATPARVMLLGEANAGKTTAANVLLGGVVLPSSIVAPTRYPTRVCYGDEIQLLSVAADGTRTKVSDKGAVPKDITPMLFELMLPAPRLKTAEILDMPSNATLEMIEHLPIGKAPTVPVWCTPASQAWTESERQAWQALGRIAARNSILALTGVDQFSNSDLDRIVERLRYAASGAFRYMAYVPQSDHLADRGVLGLSDLIGRLTVTIKQSRKRKARRIIGRLAERVSLKGSELAEKIVPNE